jgi:hypothetical protein
VSTAQHLEETLVVAPKDRKWPLMLDLETRPSGASSAVNGEVLALIVRALMEALLDFRGNVAGLGGHLF